MEGCFWALVIGFILMVVLTILGAIFGWHDRGFAQAPAFRRGVNCVPRSLIC